MDARQKDKAAGMDATLSGGHGWPERRAAERGTSVAGRRPSTLQSGGQDGRSVRRPGWGMNYTKGVAEPPAA